MASRARDPVPALLERHLSPGNNLVDLWSTEQLAAYQSDALHEVVAQAWSGNELYRSRLDAIGIPASTLRLPRDLPRLPLLSKADLLADPWVLLSVPRSELSQINISTGTTGGEEIYAPHGWEDLFVRGLEPTMSRLVPVTPDDVVLNALPYDMSSAGLAFHRTMQRGRGALVFPAGKGGYYSTPARTALAARDLGATIILTGPSYSLLLADALARLEVRVESLPLRFLWLTGEGCSPAMRERIEGLWQRPAYFYYGSLEAGPLGVECSAKCGYHVAGGHVYVELISPKTRQPVAAGEIGEVVVTSLTRMAAPLLRYCTGDLAIFDDAPCPCGVSLPRLQLRGRASDQINIAGRSFSPYYIEDLLLRIPEVGEWYELAPAAEQLEVFIEPRAGSPAARAGAVDSTLLREVEERLSATLRIRVSATWASIARSGGKVSRIRRGS